MMKKVLFVALVLSLFAEGAFQQAGAETLSWGASTGVVEGYKVYYQMTALTGEPCNSDTFVNNIDVGNTTSCSTDILPLSQGVQYCIAVTAYNSAGESRHTESVVWTLGDVTPPLSPIGLKQIE
jgi:hypothetical protein